MSDSSDFETKKREKVWEETTQDFRYTDTYNSAQKTCTKKISKKHKWLPNKSSLERKGAKNAKTSKCLKEIRPLFKHHCRKCTSQPLSWILHQQATHFGYNSSQSQTPQKSLWYSPFIPPWYPLTIPQDQFKLSIARVQIQHQLLWSPGSKINAHCLPWDSNPYSHNSHVTPPPLGHKLFCDIKSYILKHKP